MLAASRRSSSINNTLMLSSILALSKRRLRMPSAGAGQRGALVLGWVHVRWPNLGARSGYPGLNTQGGVILKTPKMIGLLAVPVVLAAAVVSATGAFAKAPAHHAAAAASVATAKLSPGGAAAAAKPV